MVVQISFFYFSRSIFEACFANNGILAVIRLKFRTFVEVKNTFYEIYSFESIHVDVLKIISRTVNNKFKTQLSVLKYFL